MKNIIIIVLLILNFLLIYKVYNQGNELKNVYKSSDFLKRRSSKIVFDTYNYDFGVVKLDKDYKSIFSFTNTSNKKMKLKNVITSCGCTAPAWSTSPILPGEKGKIELNYHAGPAGEFVKYIAVLVEGENNPIQLEIRGNVFAR